MDKYQGEDLETMREPQWQLLSASFYPNKTLSKLFSIQKIVHEADPDILMLVEVGGRESLENFNRHFLNEAYDIRFMESNSERGIDVAFLTKKNIPELSFYLKSHSDARLKNGRRFARGLLELRALEKGKLKAVFLLTHLKSKLDLKKEDFEGRGLRGAEVEYIVKTHQKLRVSHPGTPVFVCGDLNGVIYKELTEQELLPLSKAGLKDVFEHLDLPADDRQTYYYFNKQGQRVPMQLDYILTHEKFKELVSPDSKVLDMDSEIVPRPPESLEQRRKLASDHYPVFCRLRLP